MGQRTMTQFWMVTRDPTGEGVWGGPKFRHATKTLALKEAKRLAKKTGETFHVLGIVETVVPRAQAAAAPAQQPSVEQASA